MELIRSISANPGITSIPKPSRAAHHYIPVEAMRRENSPVWQALVAGRSDESYHDPKEFQREVIAAKDDLLRRLPDHRILLVARVGTVNAIVSELIGLDRMFFFEAAYTSISRVVRRRRVLRRLDTQRHRAPALRGSHARTAAPDLTTPRADRATYLWRSR